MSTSTTSRFSRSTSRLGPFGEIPDDPEKHLVFDRPTISPRAAAGYERLRGQVVIDFFELDTREDLLEGRCVLIQLLWPRREDRSSGDAAKKSRAEAFLNVIEEDLRLPHTACGRAFIHLYDSNRSRRELVRCGLRVLDEQRSGSFQSFRVTRPSARRSPPG